MLKVLPSQPELVIPTQQHVQAELSQAHRLQVLAQEYPQPQQHLLLEEQHLQQQPQPSLHQQQDMECDDVETNVDIGDDGITEEALYDCIQDKQTIPHNWRERDMPYLWNTKNHVNNQS
jgi:hypothetical protein